MKRFLPYFLIGLIIGLLLTSFIFSTKASAKSAVTGSISLATANPAYQQLIMFNWSISGKYAGYLRPMLLVSCYQDNNPYAYNNLEPGLVYRALYDAYNQPFYLNLGSSAWTSNGGGEAECTGSLYLYAKPLGAHNDTILLDTTPRFYVSG
jgi:hypothetical protein